MIYRIQGRQVLRRFIRGLMWTIEQVWGILICEAKIFYEVNAFG